MSDALKDLEELSRNMKKLSGYYTVEFPLSSEAVKKATSLKDSGRDFFEANDRMEQVIAKTIQKDLDKNPETIIESGFSTELLNDIGIAARDLVVQRFENGGGDVSVKALKRSTVAKKGNSRVGIDTGDLYNQVKRCKPKVNG